MFFLLRVAFWLTIVLALLPSGGAQQSAQAKVGADRRGGGRGRGGVRHEQLLRPPAEACVVGAQAAVAIGQRAQAGAKMVYEFFNEHASHGSETGSVSKAEPSRRGPKLAAAVRTVPAAPGSQSTLKGSDLDAGLAGPTPARTRKRAAAAQGAAPQGLISRRSFFFDLREASTLYRGHGAQTADRRDHREFRAAGGVGRPLPLSDRARPHAAAAAGGRAQRRQQGAGLRQPGLAFDLGQAERRRRPGAELRRRQRRPYRARADRDPVRAVLRQGRARTSCPPTPSRCSRSSGCASTSRRSAPTASARWSSASAATPTRRSRP